jgi:hypothetical protein
LGDRRPRDRLGDLLAAADCAPDFNAVALTVSGSSGCDAGAPGDAAAD